MYAITTYYLNGHLEAEGYLDGDTQVGKWSFYNENGTIFSEGEFDDKGNEIGVWTEYYDNGQLMYEAISPQGNCFTLYGDVQMLNYWSSDGVQLINNGNGKIVKHHSNGQLLHVSYWENCVRQGSFQEFYDNGQLKLDRQYKCGVLDGIICTYHENGILAHQCQYKNGNPVGRSRDWDENGILTEEGEFVNEEYLLINAWNEAGIQTVVDGNGIFIRKYGYMELDVYEETYKDGRAIIERKISGYTIIRQ